MFDFVDNKLKTLIESEEDLEQNEVVEEDESDDGEKILSEAEELNEELRDDDSDIYTEMDNYIIESMKEQLRLEVLGDENISESDKVKMLKKISTLVFEDEDVIEFVNQYISPVVEICESFINQESEDPLVIPLVVYEIAAILEDAKTGRITDIYMVEDGEDVMIKDVEHDKEKDNTVEGKKDAKEEGKEVTKASENSDVIISSEMAMELINLSLDEHGCFDKDNRDSAINEAINLLALIGFDNLRPNIFEVVENIYFHDKKAEGKGQKRFFEIMEDIKSGENFPIDNFGSLDENIVGDYFIKESTEERIQRTICGQYDQVLNEADDEQLKEKIAKDVYQDWVKARSFIKNHYTNWGTKLRGLQNKFNKKLVKRSAIGGAVLTAAAILAVSIAAYRNKKYGVCQVVNNRYDKVKCLVGACDDAIRAIKSQRVACKSFAKSPAKCEMRSDKLIVRWEKKKQKYIKKLAKIKVKEQKLSTKYSK